MNTILSNDFKKLTETVKDATNEYKLPESIQKYLEYQRHCLYEAYQNMEEVKPHPTTLKRPFTKRKYIILNYEEWDEYNDFNIATLNTLIEAFKEIERLEDIIDKLQPPKWNMDEYIGGNAQQYDTEQFEKILEHSNMLIDDILADEYSR